MREGRGTGNFVITILPFRRQIVAAPGASLLSALLGAGFFTDKTLCSGAGVCGGCDVVITSGNHKKRVKACRFVVEADCDVELTDDDAGVAMTVLKTDTAEKVTETPWVKMLRVQLPEGEDHKSDWERLQRIARTLGYQDWKPSLQILRQLAEMTNPGRGVMLVASKDELLAVRPEHNPGGVYGIAFDLGTTSIVGYLHDLENGRLLGTASVINPQAAAGSDVISRIQFTATDRLGTRKMARMIQEGIRDVSDRLFQQSRIERDEVYAVSIAGNTCMQQLLMEISPKGLGNSPYRPVTTEALHCRASDIGLNLNEMARVYCLPCIGGFVGGDTVGMLVACLPEQKIGAKEICLLIDIGTNCEIVLTAPNGYIACSAAAGPAFEGGAVSQGMRATKGAIDSVTIDDDVTVHVIGDGSATGICGSGLVDAVAELLKIGIVDAFGRMLSREEAEPLDIKPGLKARLVVLDGIQTFCLDGSCNGGSEPAVVLTQMDIRQLQLAKSAIQTSVRILLDMAGVSLQDIDRVFLAGAFGNYIDVKNAARIGIIPDSLTDRVTAVGNAAGAGASRVLLSVEARERAERLARSTRHISLANHMEFQARFLDCLSF